MDDVEVIVDHIEAHNIGREAMALPLDRRTFSIVLARLEWGSSELAAAKTGVPLGTFKRYLVRAYAKAQVDDFGQLILKLWPWVRLHAWLRHTDGSISNGFQRWTPDPGDPE